MKFKFFSSYKTPTNLIKLESIKFIRYKVESKLFEIITKNRKRFLNDHKVIKKQELSASY